MQVIAFTQACQNKHSGNRLILNAPDSAYFKNLVSKEIPGTYFHISLPARYNLRESRGPDFSVYYFYPADTSDHASLRGGLYFGNSPSEFPADTIKCKVTMIKSAILNNNSDWLVYRCDSIYTVQTIINNDKNEGWNSRIHVFGTAHSKQGMHQLLEIYATLSRRENRIRKE